MSNLILPPGVEPPPNPEIEAMPPEVMRSFELLNYGIRAGTIALLRKKTSDGVGEAVYDLAIGVPSEWNPEDVKFYPIARMLPQHPKEAAHNESSVSTVPAPDPIN